MSKKELFTDELLTGMQDGLRKYASAETPKLSRAAECLHSALEILEEQGLHARADEVLKLLQKLAKGPIKTANPKVHSLKQLMDAGVSQRDLRDFARGEPRAVAKLNLVLRRLGMSEHEIVKFLGHGHMMSEEKAHETLNPNQPGSTLEFESMGPATSGTMPVGDVEPQILEFKSIAAPKKPGRPGRVNDPHVKGLTSKKEIENLKNHGTVFNMADDNCAVDISLPIETDNLGVSDADINDLMQEASFDAEDDLLNWDVQDDALEVSDSGDVVEDWEGERD